ncbi:MAG: hypothetical protein BGO01_03595 [Armatimonadetes bacterium 55-13]|nr:heavy metal-responsive transcriptional regulator [Armatimonadota bacterium]OJU63073.1 MAG: hypothetical protein BGO01_03595 [Armatimonadetes bacterium 55-13]
MKIGELARASGASISAVRFYERKGLLPSPDRTESGYRAYGAEDVSRLRLVLAARRNGFSLAEIGACLSTYMGEDPPCENVAVLVADKVKTLDRQIEGMRALRAHLSKQLAAWQSGDLPQVKGCCAILESAQGEREDETTS